MVDLIADAATRGAELTHQLLAFSRRQPLAPQSVDVSALLRADDCPLLARAIGAGIEVESRLADELPPACVDPSQLENALLNLAINARDAMPDGGTFTVETSLERARRGVFDHARRGSPRLLRPDFGHATRGRESRQETLPHVFEPFFTTKPTGEGSGLGLAMVWGFAKQTGGARHRLLRDRHRHHVQPLPPDLDV